MQGWAGPSWSPHGAIRARMMSHRRGRPGHSRGTEVSRSGFQETSLNSSLGRDPLHPLSSTFGIQIVFAGVVHGFCEDPWGFPAHSTPAPVPLPLPPLVPPASPPHSPPARPGPGIQQVQSSGPQPALTPSQPRRCGCPRRPPRLLHLAHVSTAGLQPASPLPDVGKFLKGSGFPPCSVTMSGPGSLGLACRTYMPTCWSQHTYTHANTHCSSHSRGHAHKCTSMHKDIHTCNCVHGPSWPGWCQGNAGLAVYGTNQ